MFLYWKEETQYDGDTLTSQHPPLVSFAVETICIILPLTSSPFENAKTEISVKTEALLACQPSLHPHNDWQKDQSTWIRRDNFIKKTNTYTQKPPEWESSNEIQDQLLALD